MYLTIKETIRNLSKDNLAAISHVTVTNPYISVSYVLMSS